MRDAQFSIAFHLGHYQHVLEAEQHAGMCTRLTDHAFGGSSAVDKQWEWSPVQAYPAQSVSLPYSWSDGLVQSEC